MPSARAPVETAKEDSAFDLPSMLAALARRACAGAGLSRDLRAAQAFLALRAAFDDHPDMDAVYSFCFGRDDFRFLFEVAGSRRLAESCHAVADAFALVEELAAAGREPETLGEREAARIVAERSPHDGESFRGAMGRALADLDLVEAGLRFAYPKLGRRLQDGMAVRAERGMAPSQMAEEFQCPAAAAILEAIEIELASPGARAKAATAPSL